MQGTYVAMTRTLASKEIKFGILGATVLLLAMATPLAGTGLPAASASFGLDNFHQGTVSGVHEAYSNHNYCPSQNFLADPFVQGQKKILDISFTAKNDEDSGLYGYWGLDHFVEHLKVWSFPNGTLYAVKGYYGVFVAPQGASSPNSTGTSVHLQSESSFGTITGGYVATFSGTFSPGTNPTRGNIGSFDFGGKISDVLLTSYHNGQTGDTHPYDWTSAYFTNLSGFAQPHWGWSYKLDPIFDSAGSINQWCNYNTADGGNSGDIFTP